MGFLILPVVVLTLMGIAISGCSTSVITKDCKQVGSEEKWVCKTIKPWE